MTPGRAAVTEPPEIPPDPFSVIKVDLSVNVPSTGPATPTAEDGTEGLLDLALAVEGGGAEVPVTDVADNVVEGLLCFMWYSYR